MNYKRLTEKTIGCFQYDLKDFKHKIGEFGDYDAFFAYSMAVKRLGEIEDKIENGTLVELPCKVGTTIYQIYKDCSNCSHFKETGWEYDCWCDFDSEESKTMFEFDGDTDCVYIVKETEFTYNHINGFGKDRFLTKAEAEKKLEELKNG